MMRHSQLRPVLSADDEAIAPYRDIRERDLRRRDGLFIAEGKVVLDVLLDADRYRIHSLLLLENRVDGMADMLARVPDDVPIHVAGRAILDEIAGFPMHRGVLALAARRKTEEAPALLATLSAAHHAPIVLGLIGIANHDNMGALFRNAAAFGVDAILMDETCCDPLYRKAIRVSVGAALRLPFAHGGAAGRMIDQLQDAGFGVAAASPCGQVALRHWRPDGPTALLVGAEGPGLPQAIMARCETLRIEMSGVMDSLNVAAAAGIALHHLWARRLDAPASPGS